MPEEELEIIRAIQKGDLERFGELYDAYIKKIYNFIFYKTHHREVAEDLTSETFRKALASLGSYEPRYRFSAWLYRIARNTVIDYYRIQKPTASIEDAWDIADDRDFTRDIDVRMKLEKVEEYLSALPAIKRDIIIMRVWQGMSYKEIADVVDKSEDNCKKIFSRAIADLKSAMPLSLFLFFCLTTRL